jgi:hypothetical protein
MQAEITKILEKSVCHLTDLQFRVQDFMDILLQMSSVLKRTVRDSRLTIKIAANSERLVNPAIEQVLAFIFPHHMGSSKLTNLKDLREKAFKMKVSFNFILRATEIYVAISTKFITPTIRKVGELRLYQAGSEAAIKEKLEALNQVRLAACEGTDNLACQVCSFHLWASNTSADYCSRCTRNSREIFKI